MYLGRSSNADGIDGPSSCPCSSQPICTEAESTATATLHGIRSQQCDSSHSSSFSFYFKWIRASLHRALRSAHATVLKSPRWSNDSHDERARNYSGKCDSPSLPSAALRWLHASYEALATTRVCSVILLQVDDGPLVVHLTLLLVGTEIAQATSFFLRYRRAVRASAKAKAMAAPECVENAADVEEPSHLSTSLHPVTTQAPPPPEMGSVLTGRSRLPQGSSRALYRLCSYWALLERAVRAAPRKRAGAPTDVTELGWFFRTLHPGHDSVRDGGGGHKFDRLTPDGVPHGAETVLVLPDDAAFPVLAEPGGCTRTTPPMAPSEMSIVNDEPLAAGRSPDAVSPIMTEKPAVKEPWKVMHLLWTDMVRYSVTHSELRQLLLDCTVAELAKLFASSGNSESLWGGTRVPQTIWGTMGSCSVSSEPVAGAAHSAVNSSLHPSGAVAFSAHYVPSSTSHGTSPSCYADPRVAVACAALTWYLSLVREVYEAVVVHEDAQRCADALEELQAYGRAVYQRGIAVGAAFFDEALRSVSCPGVKHASSTRSRVVGTNEECACRLPRRHEKPTGLPEAAVTAHGNTEGAVVCSTVPMAASAHLGNRCESHSSNLLCRDGVPVATPHMGIRGASPRICWAELTAALAALLRRRRLMEMSHVRSLFSYMYTGSVAKMTSIAVLTVLTCLSSRVAAVGLAVREAIGSNLDTYYRTQGALSPSGSDSDSSSRLCGSGTVTVQQRIFALCLFEWMRLAMNTVLAHTMREYIAMAASQRRNAMKAALYEALTRLPLAFFDLHSFDEVEQIVYYVNDIEGVEVHVHRYICSLVTSLSAMQHAMHQLPRRARLLVGATVAVSLAVKYIGRRMKQLMRVAQRTGGVPPSWLRGYNLNGTASAAAELDAQVEENTESNARRGGVMLRGLDIVAALPQLRPYAADFRLMRSWTDHTRACGAAEAATFAWSLRALPSQAYGQLLPALGGALLTFADWVLPTFVASYGTSTAFCSLDTLSLSNRLIEAMRCVSDTVDVLVDGHRVAEVVLLNAYKASVLEKVLDARRWEPTTADYAKGVALGGEADGRNHGEDDYHTADAGASCGTPAAEVSSRHYVLRHHHLRSLYRAGTHAATAWPPPLTVRWMRVLKDSCRWCVTHLPRVLTLGGRLRLAWRVLATMGLVKSDRRGSNRHQSRQFYHHHRRPPRPRHVSCWRKGRPQQVNQQQPNSAQDPACGVASEAAEVCLNSRLSEDDGSRCAHARPSSSSFSDDSELCSEAAAAAAAAALANATVHAVAVQSLQFYYPTAPTVPVFAHPITCTVVLQGNRNAFSSSLSSSTQPRTVRGTCASRGQLVCLVGPSGHGKSTLLSLLLGMYTNYGASSHVLGTGENASSGGDDGEERQESGVETQARGGLPLTPSSSVAVPDIVLTLALPHSPPSSSEALESTDSPSAAPTSSASVMPEVEYVQLSVALIPRDILRGNLFSFVPQNPIIFSGATIAHNISLENYVSLEQEELMAEIAQCAAWAHCEYIQRFPQGLMTYIADSGAGPWASPLAAAASGGGGGAVRLSVGQAQRLMMARALFHGRRSGSVLVMDEPTASLDKEVKLKILEEWRGLLEGGIVRGMLCATHDDDLIAVADEVVRLP
ncbi:hypothetical protein LPMP_120870 [Leishmania panamensis]|uniref:Nucleoside triphosphate hydrolase, putative n=1 Tax=Leishmania panamensis TaxID=5679 RepID=A0A088RMH6_LEIPA|nr:hypothetical protein LPMP_120870 [Leishmania panamensis]AIN96414.1 hypothetical protein LPMP_120870 [Leishmania panamensis]